MKIDMFFNNEIELIKRKIESMPVIDCIKESILYISQDVKDLSGSEAKFISILKNDFPVLLEKMYYEKYKDFSKEEILSNYIDMTVNGNGIYAICDWPSCDVISELEEVITNEIAYPIIKDYFLEKISSIIDVDKEKRNKFLDNNIKNLENMIEISKKRIEKYNADINVLKEQKNG